MNVEMYERALRRTGEVVAGTRRDQLDDPTPCSDWRVRDLLNHIIGGCTTFAAGAVGRAVAMDAHDYSTGDYVRAYERAAADALGVFRAPGSMEKTFTLPAGQRPGASVLGTALADAVVHGWDLAQATGRDYTIDEDAAAALYGMVTKLMQPRGPYPREPAFKEPVAVGDDATATEKLLGYLGRQP